MYFSLEVGKHSKVRVTSSYLLACWRLIAGCWEAWSSPWGRWTLLLVEIHCPASPPTAHKLSPRCHWSHFRSTLQSSPVNKAACYTKAKSLCRCFSSTYTQASHLGPIRMDVHIRRCHCSPHHLQHKDQDQGHKKSTNRTTLSMTNRIMIIFQQDRSGIHGISGNMCNNTIFHNFCCFTKPFIVLCKQNLSTLRILRKQLC